MADPLQGLRDLVACAASTEGEKETFFFGAIGLSFGACSVGVSVLRVLGSVFLCCFSAGLTEIGFLGEGVLPVK